MHQPSDIIVITSIIVDWERVRTQTIIKAYVGHKLGARTREQEVIGKKGALCTEVNVPSEKPIDAR